MTRADDLYDYSSRLPALFIYSPVAAVALLKRACDMLGELAAIAGAEPDTEIAEHLAHRLKPFMAMADGIVDRQTATDKTLTEQAKGDGWDAITFNADHDPDNVDSPLNPRE